MSPYNNRELLTMTKEITIAMLNGGTLAEKTEAGKKTADFIQSVYNKLSELNKEA